MAGRVVLLVFGCTQTLMGPHMEGSDPHMEGSGVSNLYVLRDQGLFGASGYLACFWIFDPPLLHRLLREVHGTHSTSEAPSRPAAERLGETKFHAQDLGLPAASLPFSPPTGNSCGWLG